MEILTAGKPQFNLHVSRAKTFGKQSLEVEENIASTALYDERQNLRDP